MMTTDPEGAVLLVVRAALLPEDVAERAVVAATVVVPVETARAAVLVTAARDALVDSVADSTAVLVRVARATAEERAAVDVVVNALAAAVVMAAVVDEARAAVVDVTSEAVAVASPRVTATELLTEAVVVVAANVVLVLGERRLRIYESNNEAPYDAATVVVDAAAKVVEADALVAAAEVVA